MKYYFAIIILSVFLLNACYTVVDENAFRSDSQEKKNEFNYYDGNISGPSIVSGQGIVTFIKPGGTREEIPHWGYILKNPERKVPPEDERITMYLEPDSIIKKYLDKTV